MASNVLPQALVSIPKTTCIYSSNKLAFSTLFPYHLSSFKSSPITLSRVSSTKLTSTSSPILALHSKRPVTVRADSSSEVGETNDENPEVESSEEVAEESGAVAVAVAEAETETETETEAEEKPPRKPRIQLGDIMGILNKRAIEASDELRFTPDLRTGDIVQIKLEVPENKRRASIYKGIVISKQNAGIHTTIRIRRIIAGIGVEIVFPVYSPNIKEIKVVKHRKVRRARLYYLRDKLPRLSTFK